MNPTNLMLYLFKRKQGKCDEERGHHSLTRICRGLKLCVRVYVLPFSLKFPAYWGI